MMRMCLQVQNLLQEMFTINNQSSRNLLTLLWIMLLVKWEIVMPLVHINQTSMKPWKRKPACLITEHIPINKMNKEILEVPNLCIQGRIHSKSQVILKTFYESMRIPLLKSIKQDDKYKILINKLLMIKHQYYK